MECYLIRHTQPDVAVGTCYGRLDLPLSVDFAEQAKPLEALVRNMSPNQVYSSPAQRCLLLAQKLTTTPLIEPSWSEFDFGDWEGRLWCDIEKGDIEQWNDNLVHHRLPNGESLEVFHQRVVKAWFALCNSKDNVDSKIVIVTHAGVIRSIVASLLGIPLENSVQLGLAYGSVTKVICQGKYCRLDYLNRLPDKKPDCT
ncbi:alpha-ribazole phosphatase family protein [Motilimonas sp. 1_MG-2023]|uniref:alpha-ribazole phosphatase family protein n=1 Tax=Motilimonas sp. 1_MG-2023 TaxID=3062672 RepID=UPI0026E3A39C|nr:alpha-ribazole phosphatase family protein [Motilimonas sp. 1_MG-2023]MDO6524927.1 alpha-ribazole phosphatase family protein [Motilimonas sp. 1_MG-2023]